MYIVKNTLKNVHKLNLVDAKQNSNNLGSKKIEKKKLRQDNFILIMKNLHSLSASKWRFYMSLDQETPPGLVESRWPLHPRAYCWLMVGLLLFYDQLAKT